MRSYFNTYIAIICALLFNGILVKSAYGQDSIAPPFKSIRLPVNNEGIYLLNVQGNLNVQPGDTLLIPKRDIKSIKLVNFHGSSLNPVIIIPEDSGQYIGGYKAYGIAIGNASYFKIVNVHVDGKSINQGVGIIIGKGCSDYSIENCISENNGIGFQCKVTPMTDDPETAFPTVIKNVIITDCIAKGNRTEGFYIGYSGGAVNKDIKPILIDSLTMINITSIDNGWDGIQVTRAKNFTGRNFHVSGFGLSKTPGQNSGIALQSDVSGSLNEFEVMNGRGAGLTIFGRGDMRIKNGTIKNVGNSSVGDAIYVNDYPTGYEQPPLKLTLEDIAINGFTRFPVNVVNAYGTMKPGTFRNITYKNGLQNKQFSDNSKSRIIIRK